MLFAIKHGFQSLNLKIPPSYSQEITSKFLPQINNPFSKVNILTMIVANGVESNFGGT